MDCVQQQLLYFTCRSEYSLQQRSVSSYSGHGVFQSALLFAFMLGPGRIPAINSRMDTCRTIHVNYNNNKLINK